MSGRGRTQSSEERLRDLDLCVELYKALRMPLPPSNAVLVAFDSPFTSTSASTFSVGYRVGRAREGRAKLWSADERISTVSIDLTALRKAARYLSIDLWFQRSSPINGLFTFAIIERIRNHDDVALDAFERSIDDDLWKRRWGADLADNSLNRTAELALDRCQRLLVDPLQSRGEVLIQLKLLTEIAPAVGTRIQGLIRQVKATIDGNGAGNPWIDALCETTERGDQIECQFSGRKAALKPIQAVIDQGFNIVPALINHLGDDRLTRAVDPPFHNKPATLWTVGQTCREILYAFRGDSIRGDRATPRQWRKWWTYAHALGEREYCRKALKVSIGFPSAALLRIARRRCPDIILEAFDSVVDGPELVQVYPYLDAMRTSRLSRAKVLTAARRAASSRHQDQVHSGLWKLYELSPEDFDEALIRALDAIPAGTPGGFLSREASFGQQVAYSDSPAVWEALLRLARRVAPEHRRELISEAVIQTGGAPPKQIVRFLMPFFDRDYWAADAQTAQLTLAYAARRLSLELSEESINSEAARQFIEEAAKRFIDSA